MPYFNPCLNKAIFVIVQVLCTCTVVLFLIQNSAFKKILEEIITSTSIIVNIMVRAVKKVQPENLNDSTPNNLVIYLVLKVLLV